MALPCLVELWDGLMVKNPQGVDMFHRAVQDVQPAHLDLCIRVGKEFKSDVDFGGLSPPVKRLTHLKIVLTLDQDNIEADKFLFPLIENLSNLSLVCLIIALHYEDHYSSALRWHGMEFSQPEERRPQRVPEHILTRDTLELLASEVDACARRIFNAAGPQSEYAFVCLGRERQRAYWRLGDGSDGLERLEKDERHRILSESPVWWGPRSYIAYMIHNNT